LQPWNPNTGEGFLLAYRQGSQDATQRVALRGIRGDGSFTLTAVDPAAGSSIGLGTFSAEALRSGIDLTIPDPSGYAIIRIVSTD
jgi:hypothetical protein